MVNFEGCAGDVLVAFVGVNNISDTLDHLEETIADKITKAFDVQ